MKKYLVHFKRGSFHNVTPIVLQQEQQKLSELMVKEVLSEVLMSKKMDNLWMTFNAKEENEVLEIIKTFPMSKELYFEIHEIIG